MSFPDWRLFLLWFRLLMECHSLHGFLCKNGYFAKISNVAHAGDYLVFSTTVTGVSSIIQCTAMCLKQSGCRSVVYDQSSSSCYVSSAAVNVTLSGLSTSMVYAMLQSPYCDYNECNGSTVYRVLPHLRVIYNGCNDARIQGKIESGPYFVDPDGTGSILVWCDFRSNETWTVFQRRLDGSVNFYRGWTDYRNGFGNVCGEYWLGLENIYRLTRAASPKLSVYLEDFEGAKRTANYTFMNLRDESDSYRLTLGSYSGDAGDAMGSGALYRATGMKFSTMDRDNDISGHNCALIYHGAWWYSSCFDSNVNGLYMRGFTKGNYEGVNWIPWRGGYYSLRTTVMRVAV